MKLTLTRFFPAAAAFLAVWLTLACTPMKNNAQIGIHGGRLSACPSTPNCVNSDAEDEPHRIEPFHIAADARLFWDALKDTVADRPRTRIVTVTEDYLHAEEKSRIFGFVDDIEFHLRPSEGIAAVRSASRTGRSDLGVNRKRVEAIRFELKRRGIVR